VIETVKSTFSANNFGASKANTLNIRLFTTQVVQMK